MTLATALTEVAGERIQRPNHRETVALRKLNAPPGFKFYKWKVVGDAVLMTGCVVTTTYKSGAKKGQPKYDGQAQTVAVTDAEERDEFARFEAETGKCGECVGQGDVWTGWHHLTGHSYKTCPRCNGSREAPVTA